jgi:hypothetical protein
MSQRRLAFPGTMQQGQREINRLQEFFSGAMNVDVPASELGQDEVILLKNLVAYQKYVLGRPGSVDLDSPGLPEWKKTGETEEHTYFTAYKSGTHVFITGTNTINLLSAGMYLIWPGGYNDQITAIIDPGTGEKYFVSRKSEDREETEFCTVRKPVYAAEYHDRKNLIVVQVGSKLYKMDNEFQAYLEIPFNGRSTGILAESRSRIKSDDNDVVLFNAAGIYRVRFVSSDEYYYYKVNSPVPTTKIFDVPQTAVLKNGRRYTYAYSSIEGRYLRDRFETGANLVQEIASCRRNRSGLDYGDVFQELPIGTGKETTGSLVSGANVSPDMSDWNADDATFRCNINSIGYHTITTDLSAATNLDEAAAKIQISLRVYFPDATCEVLKNESDVRIKITAGLVDGGSIEYLEDSAFGTNIAGTLKMRSGDSPTREQKDRYTSPMQVTGMMIPNQSHHLTHLTMFGSKNIGRAGLQEGNIEDFLLWVKDVPAVRAFKGYRYRETEMSSWYELRLVDQADAANLFYQEDEGCIIRWDDGEDDYLEFLTEPFESDLIERSYKESTLRAKSVLGTSKATEETPRAFCIGANRCGVLSQIGHTVEVIVGDYNFTAPHVGMLIFWEDGETSLITAYNGDGTVTVQDSTTRDELAGAWEHTLNPVGFAGVTATVVSGYTILSLTTGPEADVPTNLDVGLGVRNNRGEFMGFILGVTDLGDDEYEILLSNEVGVFEEEDITIYFRGAPPRTFSDTVTDADLKGRQEDDNYYHWSRYYAPLPSTDLGDIAAGFMAVAEPNTNKIIYSARPNTMKFRGGYYRLGVQEDTSIVDTITAVWAFTDRICAICKRSTWGTSTAQISSIDNLKIGERVYTLPVMVQTHKVGCIHVGSIVEIGIGQAIILTSEPALRYFNGREYTEANVAQEKVMKLLKKLHSFVTCSYDDIGGYRLFGTFKIQTSSYNRLTNDDGICIRLSIKPDQGNLFSIYDGAGMVYPEPNTHGLAVENEYGYPRQVMLDETTGKWHNISPYLGPEDTGLVESFEDKDGAEIIPEIHFPEVRGELESFLVEHLESHVYLRPYYDLNEIPVIGYQENGFKDNFKINVFAYVDGQVDEVPKIFNLPLDGDACFDRTVKGKRISIKFQFSTSAFKLVSSDQWHIVRDTSGAMTIPQRETDESVVQAEYAEQAILWLSRANIATLNRATGQLGTGILPGRVEGPDGVLNSAMRFTGAESQAYAIWNNLTRDFTIQFGYKG